MTNPGISSGPTDLEGFSLLAALQISISGIRARDKNSESIRKCTGLDGA
jgi:hypothetical protein